MGPIRSTLLTAALLGLVQPAFAGDPGDDDPWLRFVGHTSAVHTVAFAPDGKRLASGDDDGHVRLWNAADGESLAVLDLLEGHTGRVTALDFSPDGSRVAVAGGRPRRVRGGGGGGFVVIRDSTTGKLELALGDTTGGHVRMVLDVAYSRDGARVAAAGNDAIVHVWNARTGAPAARLDAVQPAWAVAFAPDGKTLAAASGNTIRLWRLPSGELLATLIGHKRPVSALAFTPDGKALVSGARDHRLRVWDPRSGLRLREFEALPAPVLDLALSPDGRLVTAAGDHRKHVVFDLGTKREHTSINALRTDAEEDGIEEQVLAVAWASDGRHLAWGFASGTVLARDLGVELGLERRR